jgi:hypothetical protein
VVEMRTISRDEGFPELPTTEPPVEGKFALVVLSGSLRPKLGPRQRIVLCLDNPVPPFLFQEIITRQRAFLCHPAKYRQKT